MRLIRYAPSAPCDRKDSIDSTAQPATLKQSRLYQQKFSSWVKVPADALTRFLGRRSDIRVHPSSLHTMNSARGNLPPSSIADKAIQRVPEESSGDSQPLGPLLMPHQRPAQRALRPNPETPKYAYETPGMRFISSVNTANDRALDVLSQQHPLPSDLQSSPVSAGCSQAADGFGSGNTSAQLLPLRQGQKTTVSNSSRQKLPPSPHAMPEFPRSPFLQMGAPGRTASDAASVASDTALLLPQRNDSNAAAGTMRGQVSSQLSRQNSRQPSDWPQVMLGRTDSRS